MFPFGIFPFNVMPQMNPWWFLQSRQDKDALPPWTDLPMQNYLAWLEFMGKNNPWMGAYLELLNRFQNGQPSARR